MGKIETPKCQPQIIGAIAAGMGAFLQGMAFGYPTMSLPKLEVESDPNLRISKDEASWFAAMQLLAAVVLSPLGGVLANLFGRKFCFLLSSAICPIGWILTALSWNLATLFVGRFIVVFACGLLSVSVGVYISETCHWNLRPSLAVFQSLFLNIAFCVTVNLGYILPHWRTLAWIGSAIPLIPLGLMLYLPDTPYYLIEKNKIEEARKSLQFFRGSSWDINEEFNEIEWQHQKKLALRNESKSKTYILRRLASKAFIKPFLCVGVLRCLGPLGEANVLMLYMISIFKDVHLTLDHNLAPVIIATIQVASPAIASILMKRISSRLLYLICISCILIGDLTLGTISFLQHRQLFVDSLGWLPMVVVMVILASHQMGNLPVIQLLLAESYPSDIRTIGIGITHAMGLVFAGFNIKLFPFLHSAINLYGVFYIYAGVQLIALTWGYLTIPDNRGLSLAKVEEHYEKETK